VETACALRLIWAQILARFGVAQIVTHTRFSKVVHPASDCVLEVFDYMKCFTTHSWSWEAGWLGGWVAGSLASWLAGGLAGGSLAPVRSTGSY
jgi:hypothetical protein